MHYEREVFMYQDMYELTVRVNKVEALSKQNRNLIMYGIAGAFFGVLMTIVTTILLAYVLTRC